MLKSMINFGIQTNSVDPDQTAPRGYGSTLFATETHKGPADDTQQTIVSPASLCCVLEQDTLIFA